MTTSPSDPEERAVAGAMRRVAMANQIAGSIAASHGEGCNCVSCRTVAGDDAALGEIIDVIELTKERIDHQRPA